MPTTSWRGVELYRNRVGILTWEQFLRDKPAIGTGQRGPAAHFCITCELKMDFTFLKDEKIYVTYDTMI